jgi:hypothetical protein
MSRIKQCPLVAPLCQESSNVPLSLPSNVPLSLLGRPVELRQTGADIDHNTDAGIGHFWPWMSTPQPAKVFHAGPNLVVSSEGDNARDLGHLLVVRQNVQALGLVILHNQAIHQSGPAFLA